MQTCSTSRQHNNRGFTLVELLIVVIILAILAAIVVPQFSATTDDAKASAADSTLGNLRTAIDLYYQQHGAYPGATAAAPGPACGGAAGTGAVNSATALQEQLSLYTDSKGSACSVSDGNYKFGPYMKKPTLPPDPFNNVSTVTVVATGNLNMNADPSDTGGWKYDSKTGKLIINHSAYQGR